MAQCSDGTAEDGGGNSQFPQPISSGHSDDCVEAERAVIASGGVCQGIQRTDTRSPARTQVSWASPLSLPAFYSIICRVLINGVNNVD